MRYAAILVYLSLLILGACIEPAPGHPLQSRATPAQRSVAVTVDDLPATRGSLESMWDITDGLMRHMADHGIVATGFVNEGKLAVAGERDARGAILEAWLDAGHDLGNHTYSHPSLYTTPLADFEADVIRGEVVTGKLLADRGRELRYFRHPMLNTGPDRQTRAEFEAFLDDRGYMVAPVTIDNDEYLYARAYEHALAAGDAEVVDRIGAAYVSYMEAVFGFYERLSLTVLEREPAQILLLHANALNRDLLGVLATRLELRGYRFVSLDEALADPAYRLADEYVGRRGLSWLQRWAITMGREPGEQPGAAGWVRGY